MLLAAAPVITSKQNQLSPKKSPIAAMLTSAETNAEEEGDDDGDGDDVWVDVGSDDSEEENEEGEDDGSSAKAVVTVDAAQATSSGVEDDSDGYEALLKQYQYSWDDTQIDHNLIISLLTYIFESEYCKEGSVLVFLPGWDDISKMHRLLTSHSHFGNTRKYKIIQLHSGIPRKTQVRHADLGSCL